jgi:hypothetical protein
MVVERLEARAWVRDPGEELERIRDQLSSGDDSWARWLQELENGTAVVAAMRVTVHVRPSDGTPRTAQAENHHLWLEVGTHPALLEAQIEEVAGKDYAALAERLREFGERVTADDLADMYVHVELGDDLLAAARSATEEERARRPQARPGLGTETGRHVTS